MIADIHCHIIPAFDDGSTDIEMSMEMIEMLYNQNVRSLFCTSHGWDSKELKNLYITNFNILNDKVKENYPDFSLYMGSEILCNKTDIDETIELLDKGILFPLGKTKYVLVEFFTSVKPREIIYIVHKLLLSGWIPIISHIERYSYIFDEYTIDTLLDMGAMIQVNAYSFCEECDNGIKNRARWLLEREKFHFIGSDSHQSIHRRPNISSGVDYIYKNTSNQYAKKVCFKNAIQFLVEGEYLNDKEN